MLSTLEKVKLVLEIVAIPLAGYWAYTRFHAVDAPDLLPRIVIDTKLSWQPLSKGSCFGFVVIDIRNNGKQIITVDSIRVRALLGGIPTSAGLLSAINPPTTDSTVSDTSYTTGDQIGQYEPTVESSGTHAFLARSSDSLMAFFVSVVYLTIPGRPPVHRNNQVSGRMCSRAHEGTP